MKDIARSKIVKPYTVCDLKFWNFYPLFSVQYNMHCLIGLLPNVCYYSCLNESLFWSLQSDVAGPLPFWYTLNMANHHREGATLLGIQFAPLRIPLHRRLQTLAVLQWILSFLFLGIVCLLLTVYLCFTQLYFIPLLYIIWFIYDRQTPERGGRPLICVRKWRVWCYMRDYFPIRLIKTAELDPSRNYILGFHPHGVMGEGAFCNFATEANRVSELYPGIRTALMVTSFQFNFPFHREYLLSSGKSTL